MLKKILIATVLVLSAINLAHTQIDTEQINESKWKDGFLDIHFIHSGRGNVSFMVFPDGTSLLYDVGDAKQRKKHPYYPPFTDSDKTAPQRVISYIHHYNPKDTIDYALISHFHNDHYGEVTKGSIPSNKGEYLLTGITEVGDSIPIRNLIDRAFPDYNHPFDLRTPKGKEDPTMVNYLKFIIHHQKLGMNVMRLDPGSVKQIALLHHPKNYPDFKVRNVKVNNALWTGKDDQVGLYPFKPPLVNEKGYYNENPLSLALKISYGYFDYYVGGDTPGTDDYPDYDIETPIANIIGQIDALTLHHHGHKDASNAYFLSILKPQVIAHQSLHSPHFAENVLYNLKKSKADVFSPFMGEKIKKWFGKQIDKVYKSTKGNFFIRVHPGGNEFYVYVLEPTNIGVIKGKFGPYSSKH